MRLSNQPLPLKPSIDMQTPSLIIIKDLSKSYRSGNNPFFALRNISLEIEQGDSVAIMGPSGSGKSTLLHLLGCLDRPSKGSYSFNGQDILSMDDATLSFLRATQIGFVFQSFNLIPQLDVFENIEIPFSYCTLPLTQDEIKRRIIDSIERVKLKHRLNHLPSQLSGGEIQRVAIARALAINPLLILADEPTGNLDRETGEIILKLFQEINRQGTTIIIVTHDPHVASHCKRTLYMQDGVLDEGYFNYFSKDCKHSQEEEGTHALST